MADLTQVFFACAAEISACYTVCPTPFFKHNHDCPSPGLPPFLRRLLYCAIDYQPDTGHA